ncbi:rhomboid family intramembrane serine protease [bacterium]|nr:rhomboid family intramembrane serine protease [bacterium]
MERELDQIQLLKQPKRPFLAWVFFALQAGIFAMAVQRSQNWMSLEYPSESWIGPLISHRGDYLIAEKPLRVLSCLFVEVMGFQAVLNLMMFWQLGPELEKLYGKVRFAFLYAVGGLGSMLLCDLFSRFVPSLHVGPSFGLGERHAIFVAYGSIPGLMAAFQGFKAAATSRVVWGRMGFIAIIVVLSYLLAYNGRFGIGIDLARWITDLVVGAVLGWFLGMSLLKGRKQLAGIALSAAFLLGVGGELGFFVAHAREDGRPARKPVDAGARSPNSGGRMSEDVLTPRPSFPEEKDPDEIARVRTKAAKLLDPLGPVPEPASDADTRSEAAKLAEELRDFEDHWTKTASANIEAERAELHIVAGELATASDLASKGVTLYGATPPPPGSMLAKHLARCYAAGAICELHKKNPDEIAALSLFGRAVESDPVLPEAHFFVGKLSSDARRRKEQLKQFLGQVGMLKPPHPESARAERIREATRLLGD